MAELAQVRQSRTLSPRVIRANCGGTLLVPRANEQAWQAELFQHTWPPVALDEVDDDHGAVYPSAT